MTSTIRKMSLREKYFIHTATIPAPNTWCSLYGEDADTLAALHGGEHPPGHSAPWYDAASGISYLLKDAGITIYQKSDNGVTQRIFRKIQWSDPATKQVHAGYICVFSLSGEVSPFVRHG